MSSREQRMSSSFSGLSMKDRIERLFKPYYAARNLADQAGRQDVVIYYEGVLDGLNKAYRILANPNQLTQDELEEFTEI